MLLQRDSHDKSLSKGRHEVALLVDKLSIHPRISTIESAEALYKLALSRNFTRGRRTTQVSLLLMDSQPSLLACLFSQVWLGSKGQLVKAISVWSVGAFLPTAWKNDRSKTHLDCHLLLTK